MEFRFNISLLGLGRLSVPTEPGMYVIPRGYGYTNLTNYLISTSKTQKISNTCGGEFSNHNESWGITRNMYQSCTGNNPGSKSINFRTFMTLETTPVKRYSAEIVSCKFYSPMIPRTLVSTPHICAGTTPPHGATTNHPAGSFCFDVMPII